ncbi:MAG: hypothetical protein JXA28_06155 [Bacteroidetes bacterium]|nr:hypothetical protein [Bacteroidota bacterium]
MTLILTISSCGDPGRQARMDDRQTDTAQDATDGNLGHRIIVDSLFTDCTGDGVPELVLTSRTDSLDGDPIMHGGFDRVDILSPEPSGGYRRLFFDVVDYGRSLDARDVTGDNISDVIVLLDAGGNNPIASRGMHLYGRNDKGNVTLLFYSSSGHPVLRDLNDDGSSEILLSDQFWGMVAHSDVIGFTSEIYTFDAGTYVAAKERFPSYFDSILRQKRAEYEQLRNDERGGEEQRTRRYLRFAEYLVWSYARGGASAAGVLWRTEREYLRSVLSQEQCDDLESFVDEVQAMEHQARRGLS